MEILFLGTGTSQGVPPIACKDPVCLSIDQKDKRLRSSIMIKGSFGNIVIDTTTDFRTQLLRENIDKVDVIFYTHEHIDHTGGLDDIRPLTYENHKVKEMPIFASENVINHLKKAFYYIFEDEKYKGIPRIKLNQITSKNPFYFNNEKIIVIEGTHGKLPIFGYRIRDFTYMTDFNFIPKNQYHKLENLDILIINCLRKEPKHHSHFILEEVLEQIKIIKPKRTFLTHISHNFGFHRDIERDLPQNVYVSFDGLKIGNIK